MIRYSTSGESHGKALAVIIEGIPKGVKVESRDINRDLARRQSGFGRGERMNIEKDKVEILSGVRFGKSLGSPITLIVPNLDWPAWEKEMSAESSSFKSDKQVLKPRPGHADLAGFLKYESCDIRDILERASARETAARVAAGAIFKSFILEFGVNVYSFVKEIGGVKAVTDKMTFSDIVKISEKSSVRTPDLNAAKKMEQIILKAKKAGDTLGGVFCITANKVPAGLGNHTQWDLKLDGRIAQSMMSIHAVKGVEIGAGFKMSGLLGSKVHDEIFYLKEKGYYRKTNNAGGLEGGITNGQDIVVNCVMKPIPSLVKPLMSVNVKSKHKEKAEAVRSDICAVPAAGIVGESVLAFEIARAIKEKFAGDSLKETKRNYLSYIKEIKKY